jgi:threonine dehydrogenase-like Zn-dependent dehydrogenase
MGVARDGAAREFLTINYNDFIMCQDMDFTDIALIEPLSVGRHAVVRAGDVKGKNVLLFGFGIIGVGVLMELKRQGATVIVAEISDLKLSLAKQMGADHVINTSEADYKKKISDIVGNKGINAVIDAVGASVVVSAALDICSVAGTVVFIGYHSDLFPFNSKSIVSKELSVLGSRNALLADFEAVRETLKSNIMLKEILITKRFSFDDLEKAFMFWSKERNSVTKILIDI